MGPDKFKDASGDDNAKGLKKFTLETGAIFNLKRFSLETGVGYTFFETVFGKIGFGVNF